MTHEPSLAAIPGPRPMSIVGWRGNMLRFFNDPIGYMDPLPRAFGSVVSFSAGGGGPVLIRAPGVRGTVFGFGPACNQAVLTRMDIFQSTRIQGPPGSRSFERLFSGLFNMNEDRHKQQRRLLHPAFTWTRLEGYHDTMVALTARMLDQWSDGQRRDLCIDLQRLTLDVANKTLFGLDPSPGVYSIGEQIQAIVELALSPASAIPLDLPFTPRRRLVEASDRLDRDIDAVIAARRASGGDSADVLATLLATRDEDGTTLTDAELTGHLFLLFLAGHDTTRSALSWALFLLSQHPRVLNDLMDELRGALRGSAPSVEQLGRLPLLERVVKETLRLFTPAPMAPRLTVAPTTLDGRDLPVGTEVILSYFHTHRDPDLYPDPASFLPGRWEGLTRSPYEYVPFGAGARMCLGAQFGMMEMKIVLAMLLQRFHVELVPGARIDRKTAIVLSPRRAIPVIIRSRGSSVPQSHDRVRGDVLDMVNLS